MTPVRWLFAATVLVHLVVLYAPSAPSLPSGGLPLDKVVHLAVFAAVVWTGRQAGLPAVPLLLVVVAHAGLSEAVQAALLPARSGDWADVAADVLGAGVGAVVPRRRSARDMMET